MTLTNWPTPILAVKHQPKINLTRLNQEQKGKVWRTINTNNPALARLLTEMRTDENIQSLIKEFDCEIEVYEQDLINQQTYPR